MKSLKGGVKRTPSQQGKASRDKGAAYERAVAISLRPVYPEAKRGLKQPRSGSEESDVTHTPWWVEAKAHGKVAIRKAYEQGIAARTTCQDKSYHHRPVLVVAKDDGKIELVAFELDVFVALMRELEALRKAFDDKVEG